MKLIPTLVWVLTIFAFVFLFFSLRTETNQLLFSVIALVFWGAAFLVNKFKKDEDQKET